MGHYFIDAYIAVFASHTCQTRANIWVVMIGKRLSMEPKKAMALPSSYMGTQVEIIERMRETLYEPKKSKQGPK